MLHQCDNYGFSIPAVFCSKAQCEANGYSLVEHWNAVAGHHRDALRVSLSTPTDCVPSPGKGITITCKTRLAVNVDKLTELAIITLMEHLPALFNQQKVVANGDRITFAHKDFGHHTRL